MSYEYSNETLTTYELNAAIKLLCLKACTVPKTGAIRYYIINDDQLRKIGMIVNASQVFINDRGQLVLGGNGNLNADDELRRFKYALEECAANAAEDAVKSAKVAKAKFALLHSALKPDAKKLLISIL